MKKNERAHDKVKDKNWMIKITNNINIRDYLVNGNLLCMWGRPKRNNYLVYVQL